MEVFQEIEHLGSKLLPVKVFKTILQDECGYISPHWHDFMEILYFYHGSAIVQINCEYMEVTKGQIVILNALDVHSVEGSAEYLVLQFEPQLTSDIFIDFQKAFPFSDKDKVLAPSSTDNRHIASMVHQLKEIVEINQEKLPGYEINIKGSIYKIIAAMFAYSQEKNCNLSEYDSQKQKLEKLDVLLRYVDDHYTENITIEDASKLLNYTPNYFCRFFRQVMGKTFLEYLNMYRCNKAEGMLRTSSRSVTDIALSTGFSSISYFNRIYKRYKNTSPSFERNFKDNIVQHIDNI
ncbi:MAG: AraC family transcriptional regulator [Clostridia bacterium]|nr:AraC family transcriptional regulator [Clostridia bacterium]